MEIRGCRALGGVADPSLRTLLFITCCLRYMDNNLVQNLCSVSRLQKRDNESDPQVPHATP